MARVRTGIDVLEEHGFAELREAGKAITRIAVVTNQTGVDGHGRRTIDVLAKAPGIEVDAIFSPEHGVSGSLDTTAIADSKDAATGIPVYSVYGEQREAASVAGGFEFGGCNRLRHSGHRHALLHL